MDFMTKHKVARKSRSTSSAGFTIVETLIVLAIAGLILLIVFEALPALDRSSRNNQRKQDVQTILEAISNYELNNSGDFPSCGYVGASQATCFGSGNLLQYTNLTYYNPVTNPQANPQVIVYSQQNRYPAQPNFAAALQALPARVGIGTNAANLVYVYNYEKCDPNQQGAAIISGAGYSDVVALYAIETGPTAVGGVCQQL
jgi:prepilin-type N-terminal cleavage/methylation domain-containing protein